MFAREKTNDGAALSPLRSRRITQQTFIINGNLALSHTIYNYFFSPQNIFAHSDSEINLSFHRHAKFRCKCGVLRVASVRMLALGCRNMNKWAK